MKKILVVEDHADIRRLIRLTLEVTDCTIEEAGDALTGWEAVRQAPPDLMLLDVMMPGHVDGLDLCRAAKADPRLRHVPVVVLSALGGPADRARGLQAGADAYLVKPFSPMQLLDVVEGFGAIETAVGTH